MAEEPDHRVRPRRRPRRVRELIASPDSYGLVLVLILVTYVVTAMATSAWTASLGLVLQITTIWMTLRASQARRRLRAVASVLLVASAGIAVLHLFVPNEAASSGIIAVTSGLLYLAAPVVIVRHLVLRPAVDGETLLGAIAAYLMVGMAFAFLYRALGVIQDGPFFGPQGEGDSAQDLFFSFTTLTTTGYGNLVPAENPGQSLAVGEMLIGQLFLVTAVAKVVNAVRPARRRPPSDDG
ncbi:ion channel [Kribbella amoyensis]|uniref:Ion channel n=1 Tax=Kribbella amoyensis TaxID=996641 RepID=A0A561BMG6_9ACTN|nr:ion channel [Kribbella amoyensis]TWD80012.1 ion channel [Kribbella amoyensis]